MILQLHYNGGKAGIASQLAHILNQSNLTTYIEPFVGSSNVIQHIKLPNRYGFDLCPYIITLYQALQRGWIPPTHISEQDYHWIKQNCPKDDPLYAFTAYGCSWGGKFWGGYARDDTSRNYALNAYNSLLKKKPLIMDVKYGVRDYLTLKPFNALVYCDPPYKGTTQSGSIKDFNSDIFWQWALDIARDNEVYVSEYQTPSDSRIVKVWEKTIRDGLGGQKGNYSRIEKLYLIKS